MINQFNRINNALGANRVRLMRVRKYYMYFEILNFGKFCIWKGGLLWEIVKNKRGHVGYDETANSRWLHAISLGKKRDEEGRVG